VIDHPPDGDGSDGRSSRRHRSCEGGRMPGTPAWPRRTRGRATREQATMTEAITAWAWAAAVAVALVGCAGTPDQPGAGTQPSAGSPPSAGTQPGAGRAGTQPSADENSADAAAAGKVKVALLKDSDIRGTAINVEVVRGTVHLSGFVGSEHERKRAEALARQV